MAETQQLARADRRDPTNPLAIPSCERRLLAALKAARPAGRVLLYGTDEPDRSVVPFRWFTAEEVAAAQSELRPVLDQYNQALRPAGRTFVELLVGTLSAAFPHMKGTDADAMLKLELYVLALSDFPADMLAEAARNALRCCRFFPTVAELLRAGDLDNSVEHAFQSRVKARNTLAYKLKAPERAVPVPARLAGSPPTDRHVLNGMADRYRYSDRGSDCELPIA
jgi:hypothetical protein